MKTKQKKDVITWTPKKIVHSKIDPTPNNYKIKTEVGLERFRKSKELFGLAGTTIVNPSGNGRYTLIDGNTRHDDTKGKEKFLWCSVPNRKLTPKEFEEMSGMFDFAVAGHVDIERLIKDKGKTKDWFDKWNLDVPMEVLETLGSKVHVEDIQHPSKKNKKTSGGENGSSITPDNVCMVNLFFTTKQKEEFEKMIIKASKKFSTDEDVTDTVFAALKFVTKK